MLKLLIEFVPTLLIKILVDLVVKPGRKSRSNKWLLSILAAVSLFTSCADLSERHAFQGILILAGSLAGAG